MPSSPSLPSSEDPGLRELRQIQETMARALFRPLTRGDRLPPKWEDGRRTAQVVADFIKPNARLTPVERLEIYSRSYWYRVLDCLYDDFPGVRAVLGSRQFQKLISAYLAKYPSESYTLRDLGRCLPEFIQAEPHWVEPHGALAYDTARFEWAQVLAFDNEERPALALDALLGADPTKLRFSLQPYLVLLEVGYPLDSFLLAVHKVEGLRSQASNAVSERVERQPIPRLRRPAPERIWMAVHRQENSLYYKRLPEAGFAMLSALQAGESLAEACDAGAAVAPPELDLVCAVQEWFHDWAALGWLCAVEE